jgi:hypothetical protein
MFRIILRLATFGLAGKSKRSKQRSAQLDLTREQAKLIKAERKSL